MTQAVTSETRHGRCVNDGQCSLADKATPIPLGLIEPAVCPECGKPLLVLAPLTGKTVPVETEFKPPTKLIIAGIVLIGLICFAIYDLLYNPFEDGAGSRRVAEEEGGEPAEPLSFNSIDNVLTIGATPETRDKLAPALGSAFLQSMNCPETDRQQGRSGRLLIICDVGDRRTTVTITGTNAEVAFAKSGKTRIDALVTATPRAGRDLRDTNVFGFDAAVLIVNKANGVKQLTIPAAAAVFNGKPGANGLASRYAAGNSSPEVRVFKALALAGNALPETVKRLADAHDVAAAVAANKTAIGLVTLDRIDDNRALAIVADGAKPQVPKAETIAAGQYPLARAIAVEVPHESQHTGARSFAQFVNGSRGQLAVRLAGFVPRWPKLAVDDPGTLPPGYPAVLEGGSRLGTALTFQPDTLALDSGSEAELARITDDIARRNLPGTELVVLGFAEKAPDAQARSLRLAERIAALLAERGITPATVRGLGDAALAQDKQNRRAEIWIKP